MKARDDPRHLSNLEEHMRNLEDTGLEKKDKWNPLVVRLLHITLSDSWMDHMFADLSSKMFWECESAHYEAIGVHNMVLYGPVFRWPSWMHDIVTPFPTNSTELTRMQPTYNTTPGLSGGSGVWRINHVRFDVPFFIH